MEDCVRAVLTGVAIGVFTTAVVKVNLFVIDKLATINALALETAVGMGVFSLETIKMRRQKVQSLLEPIHEHTCNGEDCTIACCSCDRGHYSCYGCEQKP